MINTQFGSFFKPVKTRQVSKPATTLNAKPSVLTFEGSAPQQAETCQPQFGKKDSDTSDAGLD